MNERKAIYTGEDNTNHQRIRNMAIYEFVKEHESMLQKQKLNLNLVHISG